MKYLTYRLSPAMWSRVLLLWFFLAVASLVVGGIALTMGQSVQSNIRDELASQQITFSAEEGLSDEERALPGIVENAGLPLTTGNQAQAYAGYIGLHLHESGVRAGYPDASYASLGGVQRGFRTAVADAREAGDEDALAEAQAELDSVTGLRNTMLTGATLRGNLLAAYGWDNVASGIIVAGAAVMVLGGVFFVLFLFEWRRGHLPPPAAETQA